MCFPLQVSAYTSSLLFHPQHRFRFDFLLSSTTRHHPTQPRSMSWDSSRLHPFDDAPSSLALQPFCCAHLNHNFIRLQVHPSSLCVLHYQIHRPNPIKARSRAYSYSSSPQYLKLPSRLSLREPKLALFCSNTLNEVGVYS